MYEQPFWKAPAATDAAPRPRPRLSIVAPCYNEEACLDAFYHRAVAAASTVAGDDFEIVLVDDGSRDATWHIISNLAEYDPRVLALRLSRNHGHQLALSAGLDLCHGELILIIDADLQDPPELLGSMIDTMMREQADVVYATRAERQGETWLKRATAKGFYRLLALASDGTDIPLDTGDFRLMTRRALDVLNAMPESSRFIRGMVAWIGFTQVPFRYQRDERYAGTTKYPLVKMVRLALDALTGFSSAPLRLAGYMGLVFTLLATAMIAFAIAEWAAGQTIPGWTSLIVVVLVIASAQMFVLGLMGEYIGRIYNQSKNRPLYIVRDVVGGLRETPALGVVAAEPAAETPCPVEIPQQADV
ncbi:glycosyltransferase family 2 protein [Novosphingobium sp.]|uniref:glycosyltransferase family 2 protein n=1 Tax=Novosphingobium sp. TaxID=1874826 RepID=UPI00333E6704